MMHIRPIRARLIAGATVLLLAMLMGISAVVAVPTSASPSSESSSGESEPVGFEPAAVSFISTSRGWALGRVGCADCAGLRITKDGGRHWAPLPSPRVPIAYYTGASSAVSDIVFVDPANGFLFGPSLLSTHDGGRSWRRQSLPPVQTVAVGAGYAYALTRPRTVGHVVLWRAAIGSDRWKRLSLPPAAAPLPSANRGLQLAVEATAVVLLQTGYNGPTDPGVTRNMLGRLWFSRDFGARWQPRAAPCTAADGGAALIGIARGRPQSWLIDCFSNEQSSVEQNTQHHLYGTVNAGASWVRLSDPTRHNLPALLANNGAGAAVLATEGVRDTLVGTFDGGRRWHRLLVSGGSFYGWADLRFATPTTGFVVGPTHNASEHVYRTDDGGRSWRILSIR
jgi:photosystem II stability/assembly factor-like uncharacterized protein